MNSSKRSSQLLIFLFLISIGFAIYQSSFHYPFRAGDDSEYVVLNGDIRRINFSSIQKWFSKEYVQIYLPLTMTSFAMDYQLWFLNPFGYRFTNFIFHCFNAFLVYLLLFKISKQRFLSFAIGLLFLIHPVQIESVAWISERKNVLSAFFILLSFIQYVDRNRLFAMILFGLAMLAKPAVLTAPILFLAYDYFFEKKKGWGFYIIACFLSVLIAWPTLSTHFGSEVHWGGGSVISNLWIASVTFFRYWILILFPINQKILYTTKPYTSLFEFPVFLALILGLILVLFLWKNRKKEPQVCFWIVWYLVFMAPMSNFLISLGSLMNDRYLYLPIIGFLSTTGTWLAKKWHSKILSISLLVVLTFVLSSLSLFRIHLWKDENTLISADFLSSGNVHSMTRKLANAAQQSALGNKQGSMDEVREILQQEKKELPILWQAQSLIETGDLKNAEIYLKEYEAFQKKKHPQHYYDVLGQYFEKLGNFEKAEEAYQMSISINPQVIVYIHLETLYKKMDNEPKAYETLKLAERIDPDSDHVLAELCIYYLKQKDFISADRYFKRLILIYPNDPLVKTIENASQQK